MSCTTRFRSALGLLALIAWLGPQCTRSQDSDGTDSAGGGTGQSPPTSGAGGSLPIVDAYPPDAEAALPGPVFDGGANGANTTFDDAATSNAAPSFKCVPPEQRALFIVADSSTSTEQVVSGGSTKWQITARGLRSFLATARSSPVQIALQFLPLIKPGSSYICETHEDCGPDGGLCYLQTCSAGAEIQLCRQDSDCEGVDNNCVTFGICEELAEDPRPLACILAPGSRCQDDLGACVDFERTCEDAIDCRVERYAELSVPLAPIMENLVTIDEALASRKEQGQTPLVEAYEGTLQSAIAWADAHPDHQTSVLVLSDGTNTGCSTGDDSLSSTERFEERAREALAHGVRSYAIAIVEKEEDSGPLVLEQLARAGGTADQFVVADSDVAGDQVYRGLLVAAGLNEQGNDACR